MSDYYVLIEGEITKIRVPKTEVKNNKWEGYLASDTINGLVKLINRGL